MVEGREPLIELYGVTKVYGRARRLCMRFAGWT